MSFAQTVLLGALAGSTIYLGLPVGRMPLLSSRSRVALAMFAVGVLAFIFVDVLSHGIGIVDAAVQRLQGWPRIALLQRLAGGAARGRLRSRAAPGWPCCSDACARSARAVRRSPAAPEVATVAEVDPDLVARELAASRSSALRTGLTIAAAIGVHNFAEGLAIGVSARPARSASPRC